MSGRYGRFFDVPYLPYLPYFPATLSISNDVLTQLFLLSALLLFIQHLFFCLAAAAHLLLADFEVFLRPAGLASLLPLFDLLDQKLVCLYAVLVLLPILLH